VNGSQYTMNNFDENFDFMTDEEIEQITGFDKILDLLRNLPQEYVSILDINRYKEVSKAIAQIAKLLEKSSDSCYFDQEESGLLSKGINVHVVADIITTSDIKTLCSALSAASSVEIQPINGDIFSIDIKFDNILKAVAPLK